MVETEPHDDLVCMPQAVRSADAVALVAAYKWAQAAETIVRQLLAHLGAGSENYCSASLRVQARSNLGQPTLPERARSSATLGRTRKWTCAPTAVNGLFECQPSIPGSTRRTSRSVEIPSPTYQAWRQHGVTPTVTIRIASVNGDHGSRRRSPMHRTGHTTAARAVAHTPRRRHRAPGAARNRATPATARNPPPRRSRPVPSARVSQLVALATTISLRDSSRPRRLRSSGHDHVVDLSVQPHGQPSL